MRFGSRSVKARSSSRRPETTASTGSPPNYPAFYPHVLTIAATNEDNRVAAFSSISPTVDLAAPGVDIPVAEPMSQEPARLHLRERHELSSPLVAGAAAWVWTVRPDLDNTQLFELMRRSAHRHRRAGL